MTRIRARQFSAGLALIVGISLAATACGSAGATATSPTASNSPAPAADAINETPQPDLVKLLPQRIKDSNKFTLGVALGSPPDEFKDASGNTVGWEVDLARLVAQSLGLQLEMQPISFDSMIPSLQAKRVEAGIGQMGVTEVRQKAIDQIGWLWGDELFAAKANSTLKVDSLDSLCGISVATTRGSREYGFAMDQKPKCEAAGKKPIDIQVFNDGVQAADSMMNGRTQVFWLGSTAVGYFVEQTKGQAKVIGHYTDPSYIGIALPKNSDMSQAVAAAIQHTIDDGTYKKVLTKWGLPSSAVEKAMLNPSSAVK